MKKKVKKIPTYNTGTISANVLDNAMAGRFQTPSASSLGTNLDIASMYAHKNAISNTTVSELKSGFLPSGIATASNKMLMNTLGIEDNSREGVTLNAAAQGSDIGGSIMPGWGHLIGGVAGGLVGSFKQGSVDPNTGEITYGGIFGRSDHSLRSEANRIKNNIRAKTMTQGIQADYYNNPNVQTQPILAAEGGIMRKPVEMLVSPGEIRINPYTLEYKQYGDSNEEPNTKDNKYDIGFEKDIILSHAPHMKLPNGKTVADNGKMILNANMSNEAKIKNIKKLVNWQEQHRTKPQEYTMYDEGTGENGVENKPIKKRRNSIWNKLQDKWNASAVNDWLENYYNNIDKYEDHAIIDGRLFIKHDGKWYDSHKGGLGRAIKGNVLPESGKGYMTDRYQTVPFKQGVFADVDKSKIVKHKKDNTAVSDIVKPNSNNGNTTNPELDFVSFRHVNSDYNTPKSDIVTNDINSAITESKKGTVGKPSSSKKTAASRVTTSTAPSPEDTVVRRPIYEEPVKTVTVPTDDTKVYGRDGRVAYDYTAPETKLTPQDLGRTVDDNNNYTGSNWKDNLYRMAVLSQPLWDRAEAEPVNYESPVYKYMPTQIDVSSQLRDTDQSYALSRYNFANLYPNTGAGMAAGLQAASNRAKQYADIRQWQTNAQNELIGKNVGIYNNWANEHARIMNDVYNKTAANRAAARNINRLNMSTSLTNVGKMMLEDKQLALNESLLNGFIPMANAVLENPYSVINPLRKLTKNYGSKQV